MKATLSTPVRELPKVGDVIAKRLHKLGLDTVADLLWHFPVRYHDFSMITPINEVRQNQPVTIKGKITLIANKRMFRRRMYITEAIVSDETDSIKAVWFNQPFITKLLQQGDMVYLSGNVEATKYGVQMVSPQYEKERTEQTHTARIVPVYSLTEKLTEKQLRFLIKAVLPLAEDITDWIPGYIRKQHHLIALHQAIREIHFPTNKQTLVQARHRLKFNELLLIQLRALHARASLRQQASPAIPFSEKKTKEFVSQLPFDLTPDQRAAAWQILQDISESHPMNRLLQGDVGSGKTVVAAIAMLNVVHAGMQATIMAPTEILAHQHAQTIQDVLGSENIHLALLTRSHRTIDGEPVTKKTVIVAIAAGEVDIVIGTQALIQDEVNFASLGLVIIDEQHRFGVDQRKKLKYKSDGAVPHLLSMTATPIPRSLALTVYGDLDVTTIMTMPANRKRVKTAVIPPHKRDDAYDFIKKEIAAGRQVFVVCPLIDESDKLGVTAATTEYERLNTTVFARYDIGLLHGKLKAAEKKEVMDRFAAGETKLLVSTTVVEVGIDVPNASIMMIEGAERFGLAQLHQLRGRVGRAEHQSYCFLFTDSTSEKAKERLAALVTSQNGFALAEKDLELRGQGEIYGLRQSGFPELKIAKITDAPIINQAKEAAATIIESDPALDQYPELQRRFAAYQANVHLE